MATEPIYEEAAGICVDSHGAAIGMPQLCGEWMPNQIFWLVIALIVIYLVLTRVALPRIAGILADRAGTITNDLAAAEDLKAKAVDAEKAYEKALADARSEAQRIATETRAEIQSDLDDAIAEADKKIAEKSAESEKALAEIREGAMESVREVARETAAALVAALGGTPDQKAIDSAVAERAKG
ncbi:F0F1 ATP synthase subunit B' [Marinibacterium profundimaris]|uniref:ATP synthase subunit b n=1 Tax=Marinibacterium profundimaris TaxID=1679460 RepID=A0A225NFV0_9RHOB|nr:F0F1 ATP synthase subunit B' [Marinibacterium profundimaris]OWU71691.1 ATP F0F1 synthase subunit B' [Marinibacterium profundimaris]